MTKTALIIRFTAKLHRPGGIDQGANWTFLKLPQDASDQLPSRGLVSVEGTLQGCPFQATLKPDGEGGHWLKVSHELRAEVGANPGDSIEVEIAPAAEEPEPEVPEDFRKALEAAPAKAMATWKDTTAKARRDFIFWIESGKKAETRVKRIEVACDKLAKGNRRPCCFDPSGRFDKSISCPVADSEEA